MNKNMEDYKRKSVLTELTEYCYLREKHDYIEVTEWNNGEGFDVDINGKQRERFSLTWGEFKALKKAVKHLKKTNI
jgi:hypothetical protein